MAALQTEASQNSARQEESAAALEELRRAESLLAAEIDSVERRAAGLAEAERAAVEAAMIVDAVERYGRALEEQKAAGNRHLAAKEHAQSLRQHWLDLREARLANAAADLAGLLEDGAPCPVCGSAEHPRPAAVAEASMATAEKEQRAREAFDEASEEVESRARELSEAQQAVALLEGKGGSANAAEAKDAEARAGAALQEARLAAASLADIHARRTTLHLQITERAEGLASLETEELQRSSLFAALTEQHQGLDSRLSALRNGYPSLQERVGHLRADRLLLQDAVQAAEDLERAAFSLAEAETALLEALPAAGFDSPEEARAVLLPEDQAEEFERKVTAHSAEAARIEELFTSEDVILAAKEAAVGELPLEAAELEELRLAAEAKDEESRRADLAMALGDTAASKLADIARKYAAAADEGRKPRERAELLNRLADTARGGGENTYRMSLNSYVLAARLEQVAQAASERLVAMSDGRFTLQHSDARAARGAKSGLGLQVLDGWTGQLRDTSTLSGGETFMASLSLALGLADVVQQEAGGVDIETLFVDEGFGSLDEQALEQVMDALEGLREGGRVVGLVSHVAEMKQRISSQLRIVKGRHGSTVQLSEAIPA
jgi:exonuclease SbcC